MADWSNAANWSGGTPSYSNSAYVTNGGTANVTTAGEVGGVLILGGTGGGTVKLNGGSLWEYSAYVGSNGTGAFVQSGGTSTPSNYLYLGYNAGDSGTYVLNGGQAGGSNGAEDVGYSGTGSFTQTGGTNSPQQLYVGCNPGSNGTYTLRGGTLSTMTESVAYNVTYGESWTSPALFQQSGGLNTTGAIYVGASGTLQLSGGTLQLNGRMLDLGVFDGGGGSGVMRAGGQSFIDLSHASIVNAGSMSVSVGTGSLVIVPSGFSTATGFGSYSCLGITHTAGTTLVVPAGQSVSGGGTIADPVVCMGTIYGVNLSGGLILSENGSVNLATGVLTTNGPASLLASGSLAAGSHSIGCSGTGTFRQMGGSYQVSHTLTIGCNPGDVGTYELGGTGSMAISGNGGSTYAFVGYSGSGAFTQTGGSVYMDPSTEGMFLAFNAGSSGVYNLDGGMLTLPRLSGGSGNSAFNFGGGTLCADAVWNTSLPMTLTGIGGNANVNTGINSVTFAGALSGPAGLVKLGAGILTLSAANSYAGQTAVNAGALSLTGSLNSSGALSVGGGTFNYAPAANGSAGNVQAVAGLTVNAGASAINAAGGNTLVLGPIERNTNGAVSFSTSAAGTITTTQPNSNNIIGPRATYGSGTSMQYATASGGTAPFVIAPYNGATGHHQQPGWLQRYDGNRKLHALQRRRDAGGCRCCQYSAMHGRRQQDCRSRGDFAELERHDERRFGDCHDKRRKPGGRKRPGPGVHRPREHHGGQRRARQCRRPVGFNHGGNRDIDPYSCKRIHGKHHDRQRSAASKQSQCPAIQRRHGKF